MKMHQDEFEARLAALKKRFPYQFREKRTSIELPVGGWLSLFEALCEAVDAEISPGDREHWHWTQVKEKFGQLRAYFEGGPLYADIHGVATLKIPQTEEGPVSREVNERIQALIEQATAHSETICQWCGAPAKGAVKDGYYYTACTTCLSDPALWGER